MEETAIERALLYIEPGPVVLVTTFDGVKNNVMTISWTIAIDFAQRIVITTGEWNHSFKALMETGECVVCIPSASMIETVVRIGMVSGADVDKFAMFNITPVPAKNVKAPLIGECIACLECKVADYIEEYGFIVLQVVRVAENPDCTDKRLVHARGDGTFVADGETYNCRELMHAKLPPGL